jgi:hypothetical protein
MLFSIPIFTESFQKQAVNPKKIFSVDNGLLSANSSGYQDNTGHLLENLVFQQLRRNNEKIYYYKNKKEIDFIVPKDNGQFELFQVAVDMQNPETKEREVEGLYEAMNHFDQKDGTIITMEDEETIKHLNKKIQVVPIRKFLL